MRMECSPLSAHMKMMHTTDNADCQCGHENEDCLHYFLTCPLYRRARVKLKLSVVKLTDWKINTLLFGDEKLTPEQNIKTVQAVFSFMKDSGRF